MAKIMLIYPPGKPYQRGEERCQSNIGASTATSMRACNDLGYCAAVLKKDNHKIFLRDYQSEKKNYSDMEEDFKIFKPDFLFISTTNATIFTDIEHALKLKKHRNSLSIILKGALFFDMKKDVMRQLKLEKIDYLVGNEAEFIIDKLIKHHGDSKELMNISGIFFKDNSRWKKTNFCFWHDDLDRLPYPDRALMNNRLYTRPDTGEAQATITVSRGCPSACTFCMTPIISGRSLRKRSPQNVLLELEECFYIHKIRNFFFKSDTFTLDKEWVKELCNMIIDSDLYGRIRWVANSRTKPIDLETLKLMKKAGCWLVAFGFESGNDDTLYRIKKNATLKDSVRAGVLAKKAGLKTYGFFMIGFPWEHKKHLMDTKRLMFRLDCDFVELHLAIPYYGTELYEDYVKQGLIDKTVLGKDYFNNTCRGTKYVSMDNLIKFRKETLLKYHTRPSYIINRLIDVLKNPMKLYGYIKYGMRLLSNAIKK